ncbi:hypothetical protein CYMTET_41486 [Cymbomonas tetramitiformis]|uniref:RRM domain-containing protein n=1 Tax=Cymbomonas tetramitiformis TaxID=36881 RepID=A0AAE0C7F5_9CHLO|nr:hypothetical protein CYMTET_41486 [Cymbomonas tetramitiformis]|eukprot:gene18755-22398_t
MVLPTRSRSRSQSLSASIPSESPSDSLHGNSTADSKDKNGSLGVRSPGIGETSQHKKRTLRKVNARLFLHSDEGPEGLGMSLEQVIRKQAQMRRARASRKKISQLSRLNPYARSYKPGRNSRFKYHKLLTPARDRKLYSSTVKDWPQDLYSTERFGSNGNEEPHHKVYFTNTEEISRGPGTLVYISNLHDFTTGEDIKQLMAAVGIVKWTCMYVNDNNESLGTAEVSFCMYSDALHACETYDNRLLDGNRIRVSTNRPVAKKIDNVESSEPISRQEPYPHSQLISTLSQQAAQYDRDDALALMEKVDEWHEIRNAGDASDDWSAKQLLGVILQWATEVQR